MKHCIVGVIVVMNAYFATADDHYTSVNVDVTIETPARYQLQEGIAVAIQNVQGQRKPLTVSNVKKELKIMEAANDVKLPNVGGKNRKEMKALERRISMMIQSLDGGVYAEPKPQDFANCTLYSKAYVAYKMSMIDDDARATYAARLGGLKLYKKEMVNEAKNKWKESFGSSDKNVNLDSSNVGAKQDSSDKVANQEPKPQDFVNRTLYSRAYVAYKMSMIDDDARATYAARLGGLKLYKKEMANEAKNKWKDFFDSSLVNPSRK